MRIAMVYSALSLAVLVAPLGMAQEGRPGMDQIAMAHVPGYPLMTLPGMRTPHNLADGSPAAALPRALITDVINFPNPFDSRKAGLEGQTQIAYRLQMNVPVMVTLYDLMGFRVRRWNFDAGQNGGREGANAFRWDGTNDSGQKVSKGGYIAQIEINLPETSVSVIRKIGVIH